jgi:5-methylcytosine-specific restriction endonuclease McrA
MPKPWTPGYKPFPPGVKKQQLHLNPECQNCGAPATQVDHIVNVATCLRHGLDPNHPTNAQSLCHDCHHAKTERERATGRARLKPHRTPIHPSDAATTTQDTARTTPGHPGGHP